MKKGNWKSALLEPALGAVVVIFCGLALWWTPLGEPWVNASYDYLFRFGARPVTNNVALILMDNAAFDQFHQTRGQPWSRALHTQLLNKLADDGCDLVVFDSFFKQLRDPATDNALAAAMRRQKHIVLMAEQSSINHPGLAGTEPVLPDEKFLSAAGTNWGVAWLAPDLDGIVRHHWPFLSPGPYPSLPETAAKIAGAKMDSTPRERWLRYYGQNNDNAWPVFSYRYALAQPANYFRHKIVFIGTQPQTPLPNQETDEFSTPYTCWTGDSSGGVEILLTETLNLINHDWLRRPAPGIEFFMLISAGILLGGLCRLRLPVASGVAVAISMVVAVAAIEWSFSSSFWFPWLIISGGQVPCALAWTAIIRIQSVRKSVVEQNKAGAAPKIPGYKLFTPPLGEGAYGRVWLAQKKGGQWCALKIIYRDKFGEDANPYEREFDGISRYQRASGKHPGLLRVDFVSERKNGFFYYAMELGDSLVADWPRHPDLYKLRDLISERNQLPARRLPVRDCVRIGIALADALDFLHRQGLTHRDIKPQNIIFVDGQPKLADPGLVAEIRPLEEIKTYLGTPGFMPPSPELPGTPQADIYGLGMVLYVTATGRPAVLFPELASSLVSGDEPSGFLQLNKLILKACAPNVASRFQTAAELHEALKQLATDLEKK